VQIYLVNDKAFNAFVADKQRMFLNTGAISQAGTPNELIGVIAHETGHIEGGHLALLYSEMAQVQTASIITVLAGVGAVAAGAASGSSGAVQAGQAIMMGGQSAIIRKMLMNRRSFESAADQAGIRYLNATGQSPRGMLETFRRFANEALVSLNNIDPYLQSHPMPRDRMSALEAEASKSPYFDRKDPPALQLRHDLMRAKLAGFLSRPDNVYRQYPPSDSSLPARYARAISSYCSQGVRAALKQIDGLIAEQPNNPYFYELKGQALLESGLGREAVGPLGKAVSLAPKAGLIRILHGQALLASDNPKLLDKAIAELSAGVRAEPEAQMAHRQLAIAYGRKGMIAEALYSSALSSLIAGDLKEAKSFAGRSQQRAPSGSRIWNLAQDILNIPDPH
jgi:predicted Zn-dependent protease